jgi:hypothetical protein
MCAGVFVRRSSMPIPDHPYLVLLSYFSPSAFSMSSPMYPWMLCSLVNSEPSLMSRLR